MCAPSPPPAPDYAGAAAAQGAANVDAARAASKLSNPSFINPLGSRTVQFGGSTFNQGGFDKARNDYVSALQKYNAAGGDKQSMWVTDGNGDIVGTNTNYVVRPQEVNEAQFRTNDPDRAMVIDSLTPAGQARFDQEQRIIGNLGNVAEAGLGRVGTAMGTPFGFLGPGAVQGLNRGAFLSPPDATTTGARGVPQYTQDTTRNPGQTGVQSFLPYSGDVNRSFSDVGGAQRGLDFAGAPMLPGVNDFSANRDAVTQAVLQRSEPMMRQKQDALDSQLVAQGIPKGSRAWNDAQDTLGRERNDLAIAAQLAGGQEQSRLFGMGLQARQQSVGETGQQGQFSNQAQQQAFQQAAMRGEFGNAAQQQAFNQSLAGGNFFNQAQQQRFQQGVTGTGLDLAAEQQAYQQALGNAGLAQQGEQQAFNQRLAAMQAGNQAEQARFAQEQSAGTFQNQARQQAIQEAMLLRQLPLNELNALRSGSQVQMPQFQAFQGTNVQPAPIFNAATASGNAAMQGYQNQVSANNAQLSGLFDIGSTVLGGAGKPWWM